MKIPPTGIPLEEIERQALIEALKMSNWVQKDAAELLVDQPARDELQDQDARHRLPRAARRPMVESLAQLVVGSSQLPALRLVGSDQLQR